MDSSDLQVLKGCVTWMAGGDRCALVTVVRTWGSSPRPVGSMLALHSNGTVIGSVSGGCIEDDLVERVRREGIVPGVPHVFNYGVDDTRAQRFGLPCGGRLELVLEPLGPQSLIPELLERIERHELVWRRLDLETGAIELEPATPGAQTQVDAARISIVLGPRWRLLIIGAGELSRFVARVAAGMGYRVEVCDPREEYRASWDLPAQLVHTMPDEFIVAARPDPHTAVLALTHDPKLDDMGLLEALRSDAFYIGALGSRANNDKRRARLRELGLTPAEVARLYGPVGLPIGSRVPAEIAISILAQLTAVKNGAAV